MPLGAPPGRPPAIDPVARDPFQAYIAALVLAAIAGIPISAIAYGFLALVAAIQHFLFTELPNQLFGSARTRVVAGALAGAVRTVDRVDHPVPAGQRRPLTRIWLQDRRWSGHRARASRHRPRRA